MKNQEPDWLQLQFDEMVMVLILLSWPLEQQEAHFVVGCAGDEMAIDFGRFYSENRDCYIQREFLLPVQLNALDKLDTYLTVRSGQDHTDFWFDLSHPDWEEVRLLANQCIQMLGKNNFTLKVLKNIQYAEDDRGKKLVVEWTKTELKPL